MSWKLLVGSSHLFIIVSKAFLAQIVSTLPVTFSVEVKLKSVKSVPHMYFIYQDLYMYIFKEAFYCC